MKFKLSTMYLKPKICPDWKTHTYETENESEIEFLKSKGHQVIGEVKPTKEPKTTEPESDVDSELGKLSYKQLKERAYKLGLEKKGNISKEALLNFIKEQLED